MSKYNFTNIQLEKMKHCLGLDGAKATGIKHRKLRCYRNYFNDNCKQLDDLVAQGLMTRSDYSLGVASKMYRVSVEGLNYLSRLFMAEISVMD